MQTPFEFTGQLENPLGSIYAGVALSIIVFLVLTAQVALYFRRKHVHSRDPTWIKGVVIIIWILQVSEITLSSYTTAISHGQDNHVLDEYLIETIMWQCSVYFATSAMTGFLVHSLFLYRVHLFERALFGIRISAMLCLVLLLEGSFGIFSALSFIGIGSKASIHWSIPVWLGLSILADILIAGSLCYILRRGSYPGSGRLNLVVKRLVMFFIQTGLITSLVGGATVAVWAVADLDAGHLLMSFPMGGVYATCLMANLLARGSSYLWPAQVDEESTIVMTGNIVFANPESLGQSVPSKTNAQP